MAKYEQNNIDNAYRYYITDSIYLHNQNPPKYINSRLYDLLHPQAQMSMEDAETVVKNVIEKAGLTVIQDDSI